MRDIVFTNDQQAAIDGLIEFINRPFENKYFITGLVGYPGTGKTTSINHIITHCKMSISTIACTSTTHKACKVLNEMLGNNIKTFTIQSLLGLRPNIELEDFNPENPQFDPLNTPKINKYKLILIDEASMLPMKLVNYIYNTCKEYGTKIIMIGDDKQLSPVNERNSTAFLRCQKLFRLNEIVRQNSDNPIAPLIQKLRYDINHKTYTFLEYLSKNISVNNFNDNNEGFSICNKKDFISTINRSFRDENYTKDISMYRVIAYTNDRVNFWNNYIRNQIIIDANKNFITKNDLIMSYQTVVDNFSQPILINSEEYIINDIVNYCDDTYKFKGYLIKFQAVSNGYITPPIFIIDHTDKFTMMKYHQIVCELIKDAKNADQKTRSKKWSAYFTFKKKYMIAINVKDRYGNMLYNRDIDYAFAITAHKSQGSTYSNVFIDVNDMVFKSNGMIYNQQDELLRRLYVACSRAKKSLTLLFGK